MLSGPRRPRTTACLWFARSSGMAPQPAPLARCRRCGPCSVRMRQLVLWSARPAPPARSRGRAPSSFTRGTVSSLRAARCRRRRQPASPRVTRRPAALTRPAARPAWSGGPCLPPRQVSNFEQQFPTVSKLWAQNSSMSLRFSFPPRRQPDCATAQPNPDPRPQTPHRDRLPQ